MVLRPLAILAAAGLLIGSAIADPRKTAATPEPAAKRMTSQQAIPLTGITLPSPDYLEEHPARKTTTEPPLSWTISPTFLELSTGKTNPMGSAGERLTLQSYAVGDLVFLPPPVVREWGQPPEVTSTTKARELIRKIVATIEPKSWSGAGGDGAIDYFPTGMALVVNQTPQVHDELAKFLHRARWRARPEVAISFKLVTVSDATLRKCGMDGSGLPCCQTDCETGGGKKAIACLTPAEVKKLVEALCKDDATNVCQAPRITTPTGEAGAITVDQSESFITSVTVNHVRGSAPMTPQSEMIGLGWEFRAEPTVSADGKTITLDIAACQKELAVVPVPTTPVSTAIRPVSGGKKGETVPFTQFIQSPTVVSRKVAEKVCVPDGGTVVLYGGKAVLERSQRQTPQALADFYCGWFACERPEKTTNHLLVLVTAEVVKSAPDCMPCAFVRADDRLTKLLGEYSAACKAGKTDDARRLAIECLAIDPTCFGKK